MSRYGQPHLSDDGAVEQRAVEHAVELDDVAPPPVALSATASPLSSRAARSASERAAESLVAVGRWPAPDRADTPDGAPDPLSTGDIDRSDAPSGKGAARLLVIRLVNYLTNHVVNRIPSFALRRLWYEHLLGITCGRGVAIHLGCYMWSYTPRNVRRSAISFGDYCYINRNCCIDIRGPLRIGANVSISPDVTILTATHGVNDPTFRVRHYPVVIEDYAWIGTRAMILPGVTLGRGCVVAAGAIVTRDVKPLEVVAGVPARPVAMRDQTALAYTLRGQLPLFE